MDIFTYFDEEHQDLERNLKELTENYSSWSREQVFDRVKVVCDGITAHLKKQETLLLNNIDKAEVASDLLKQCQADRAQVEEELGQLVMVHVDEPAYQEYLAKLLQVIERHIKFCRRFYRDLRQSLPQTQLDSINQQLTDVVHHSVDYNTLQPQQ